MAIENEPYGQVKGGRAGSQQYLLRGHEMHSAEPSLSAYCPGIQFLHSVAPLVHAAVPLAHSVCLIAGLQQYEPKGQMRHAVEVSFSA